jgi:hypothetical protein
MTWTKNRWQPLQTAGLDRPTVPWLWSSPPTQPNYLSAVEAEHFTRLHPSSATAHLCTQWVTGRVPLGSRSPCINSLRLATVASNPSSPGRCQHSLLAFLAGFSSQGVEGF